MKTMTFVAGASRPSAEARRPSHDPPVISVPILSGVAWPRNSIREQRAVLLGRVQAEVDVAEIFVGAVFADALDQRRDLEL